MLLLGWPLMGLRFKSDVDELDYIRKLEAAAELHHEKFDVYTHETMPERYHFSNNPRISPVYVVPKLGYALTGKRKAGLFFVKGVWNLHYCPGPSTIDALEPWL
jgi:hypothetical protein